MASVSSKNHGEKKQPPLFVTPVQPPDQGTLGIGADGRPTYFQPSVGGSPSSAAPTNQAMASLVGPQWANTSATEAARNQAATDANRAPMQNDGSSQAVDPEAERFRRAAEMEAAGRAASAASASGAAANARAAQDARDAVTARNNAQRDRDAAAQLQTSAQGAATAAADTSYQRSTSDRDALMAKIPTIMSSLTGEPSAGAASGSVASAGGGVNPQVARDAAFAQAKDRIGQIQRSSLTALREGMAERGTLGGGVEGAAMASLIGEGQQQLGDFTRDQLIADAERAAKIEDRNYTGDIQKRGQNLNISQSLLSLLGSSAY